MKINDAVSLREEIKNSELCCPNVTINDDSKVEVYLPDNEVNDELIDNLRKICKKHNVKYRITACGFSQFTGNPNVHILFDSK